ncbi:MAG: cell division protein ZapA [Muribaculaceae bacterium]|jgi:superfamily I DNA/RNA helicase|nr:cell division protein ZapA [Muribaculaceae bacterium]
MTDNLRITIKIADVEPIRFDIKRSEEAIYRRAEYHINKLYDQWHSGAGKRQSPMEVMARVALAFAELYYRKTDVLNAQADVLAEFEKRLDHILEPEIGTSPLEG